MQTKRREPFLKTGIVFEIFSRSDYCPVWNEMLYIIDKGVLILSTRVTHLLGYYYGQVSILRNINPYFSSNSVTARYNKVMGQASDYYILIYITKYTYTLLVVFDTFFVDSR